MPSKDYEALVKLASACEMESAQLFGKEPEKCVACYRGTARIWREAAEYAETFAERYLCQQHATNCENARGE